MIDSRDDATEFVVRWTEVGGFAIDCRNCCDWRFVSGEEGLGSCVDVGRSEGSLLCGSFDRGRGNPVAGAAAAAAAVDGALGAV